MINSSKYIYIYIYIRNHRNIIIKSNWNSNLYCNTEFDGMLDVYTRPASSYNFLTDSESSWKSGPSCLYKVVRTVVYGDGQISICEGAMRSYRK